MGEISYTRHGWAPELLCDGIDGTNLDTCSYEMDICLKSDDSDVVSLGDVFRSPFTVLSPHIAFMVIILINLFINVKLPPFGNLLKQAQKLKLYWNFNLLMFSLLCLFVFWLFPI